MNFKKLNNHYKTERPIYKENKDCKKYINISI